MVSTFQLTKTARLAWRTRDTEFTEHAAGKLSALCASVFLRLLSCFRVNFLSVRPHLSLVGFITPLNMVCAELCAAPA